MFFIVFSFFHLFPTWGFTSVTPTEIGCWMTSTRSFGITRCPTAATHEIPTTLSAWQSTRLFWSGALEWVFHRNFSREKKPGIRGTDTLNISKSWLRNDLDSYIILYNLIHIYYWYYNVYCYYIYIYYIIYLIFFACHSMNFVSALRISRDFAREFATISSVRCTRATWSRASPETSCWGVG